MGIGFVLVLALSITTASADRPQETRDKPSTGKPVDADGDGYKSNKDCDDSNAAIFPGAPEIPGDGIDQNCDGIDPPLDNCADADGDGYTDGICGGEDCNDSDPAVYPGAPEICGDGIDQDCDGADLPCDGNPGGEPGSGDHSSLTWDGSPGVCLNCHVEEARQVYAATHYQWQGDALYMTHGPARQGKIAGAMNSYCINIVGNWNTCGSCHIGQGAQPVEADSPTTAQLANIDCLVCHQVGYKRVRGQDGLFVPDTANMTITLDEAVQTVHRPVRANCLQCHAKAGGGDAVKRGDLALATIDTADRDYDVHMSTAGGNLDCTACHRPQQHRFPGKGSDIRPTDLDVEVACTSCHTGKDTATGHATVDINRHVARVACQTCHIPTYAKDAYDTTADEATETYRTWRDTHSTAPPFHPAGTKANDLVPQYRFWDRTSANYNLGEDAVLDTGTGAYPTSRPVGTVDDASGRSKLYPFKYKRAEQPLLTGRNELVALDTKVFFATADADAATRAGIANMGYDPSEPYEWVATDTFQLLNHQVSPAYQALQCTDCHGNPQRMDFAALGYTLKNSESVVCSQCHGQKSVRDFESVHRRHVESERIECSYCHTFSRPERGLGGGSED